MNFKYILKILIIAFLILSLTTFVYSNDLYPKPNKLYESFDTHLSMDKSDAFCESHTGSSYTLDTACNSLTKNNCNDTSCCNWTSNKKCVAGGKDGPTFDSNSKELDYYYFQGKCYGSGCP